MKPDCGTKDSFPFLQKVKLINKPLVKNHVQTPKFDAANLSLADTAAVVAVVWA